MQSKLITTLRNADIYPHPVTQIEVLETHISWVVLTGDYVYKLKKPVDFGFLDYTTLAQRKFCCEEELRLNQRLAPELYLDVVAICGSPEAPQLAAHETAGAFEYAVKMRQFPAQNRLDRLLSAQRFESHWIDDLALQIAQLHQQLPIVAPDSPWGEARPVWKAIRDNFDHIAQTTLPAEILTRNQQLSQQALALKDQLIPQLQQRKQTGMVRECHGDLHLANITLYQGQLRLFDCIEFNSHFRWIDTLSDLAFLLMDLEARGAPGWSIRALNQYLEECGDYAGMPLLNFYKTYRAMVRAKVAVLGDTPDLQNLNLYLGLTEQYLNPPKPVLYLMHGLSGSGKSHLSGQLLEHTGAIRIRADVERKRIAHELRQRGESPELYGQEMNVRTFNRQLELARSLLQAGHSVIIDATLIRRRTRSSYLQLADELGVNARIISCYCNDTELRQRLRRRQAEGRDASDADEQIMEQQDAVQQPLNQRELQRAIQVDTAAADALANLLTELGHQQLLPGS